MKRGYIRGEKTLEIIDGNLDLILYHENGSGTFYFYRFSPEHVLGEKLNRDATMLYRDDVAHLLKDYGKDYDGLLHELLSQALENGMKERYDM